jgi:hypothetical protein
MCAVSFVSDHFMQRWPLPVFVPLPDYTAPPIQWPRGVEITPEQWAEYQDLKRRAEEYDKATGQPDCVKPEAKRWEEAIEKVLRDKGLIA